MRLGHLHSPVAAVGLGLVLLTACSNSERAARDEMLAAQPLIQQGDFTGLIEHLEGLIEEYPETEAAGVAREMIADARSSCNDLAELKLREALVTAIQFFASHPRAEADLASLTALGLATDPDITLRVVRGFQNDLSITARHVAGDLVLIVDQTGTVTSRVPDE